ncbi:hypothetical protein QYF61_003410 [Mycteria americana]|uniref:Uncharacterized protein n=1 Tax=Mycteria americana TaxID=33587 RepID=A0AAN7NH98_MYCAM|nr:hypothetical protein QYF61_003410 [Mycteria americana]
MRTFCDSVFVDNATVDIGNHSNICVCNFTKIMGCDFNYSAPVTTHQLLQADYTLHQDLLPNPIGTNLTLVRKLLQRDDLNQLLEHIQNNGHKTLVTVHHDAEEIHCVLERVKQDGGHHWWDTLLGWSPTATGILNKMLHPVVVLLMLTVLCFILTIALYVRLWSMVKRLSHRISPQDVYVLDNPHPENSGHWVHTTIRLWWITEALCTLISPGYLEEESIWISRMTGESQQLAMLEAEVSLTGNKWQKHPVVTGLEAPCILSIDYLRTGYCKDPKGYWWTFDVANLDVEKIKEMPTFSSLLEDTSVVGLMHIEEQQALIATMTVYWW